MGMDVYGIEPVSKAGECFRANVWRWRPLAELSLYIAPAVCAHCKHWGSNDGDGLNMEDSVELARLLEAAVVNGRVAKYIERRDQQLAAMPDELCPHCNGTGKRNDKYVKGPCNSCENASGKRRPYDTMYTLDIDKVKSWIAFLKDCGGFKIC